MALSGNIVGSYSGGTSSSANNAYGIRIHWEVTNQYVSSGNKYSTVKALLQVCRKHTSWSKYAYNDTASYELKVNGFDKWSKTGKIDFNTYPGDGTWQTLKTLTYDIQHNSDYTCSFSGKLNMGTATTAGIGTVSGNGVISAVPVAPTISSLTVEDYSNVESTVGAGVHVAGISRFRLTATLDSSSTNIVSYTFYKNSVALTTITTSALSATYAIPSTEAAGSYTFSVSVLDSYGNVSSYSASQVTVSAYSNPTLSTNTFRCNSSGTASADGEYVSCTATYSISNVGSNAVEEFKVSVNNVDYSLTNGQARIIGTVSPEVAYSILYVVRDKLSPAVTITDILLGNSDDFSLHSGGGVAFGDSVEVGKLKTTYKIQGTNGADISGSSVTLKRSLILNPEIQETPQVKFYAKDSSAVGAVIAVDEDANFVSTNFEFKEYSRSSSTNEQLNTFESYKLPEADADLASSVDYEILTTKNYNPSTIDSITVSTKATDSDHAAKVAQVLTAASTFIIGDLDYYQWGKAAVLYFKFTCSSNITVPAYGNVTNFTIATLVEGKRPAVIAPMPGRWDTDSVSGYVSAASGEIRVSGFQASGAERTIAAGTTMYANMVYLVP